MISEKTRKIFAAAGASANFAGMMIAMQDIDSKGMDDKIARVITGVGTGFSRAAEGDNKSAADVLDTASAVLADIAKQLRAGKSPEEV
jgi:phage-related tail protein